MHRRLERGAANLDTSPNAIDLAFYTKRNSPKTVATVAHFIYVGFLALGLVEAAWLGKSLVGAETPGRWLLVTLGAPLWLSAVWLVLNMFWNRFCSVPTISRTK